MSQRWHHVRTADGWEIRDENGAEVAFVHNPRHDREDDARLLADAPRLRDHLNSYAPDAVTRKARLVKEQVEWIAMGFVSSERAQRFHRGVRALAKQLGRNHESVLAEIQAEAHVIATRENES